jgi:hypothetical protein
LVWVRNDCSDNRPIVPDINGYGAYDSQGCVIYPCFF